MGRVTTFGVGLAAAMVAGWLWWQFSNTGERIAFVPPKQNSDGSYDYTLVGQRIGADGKLDRYEWVLRLPDGVRAHLSRAQATEFKGGGVRLPISIRNNQILQLRLNGDTFGPFAGGQAFSRLSEQVVDLMLFADLDDGTWQMKQASVSRSCAETGRSLGALTEVENNASEEAGFNICRVANSRSLIPFVLRRGNAVWVNAWCEKNSNSCQFEMLMRGRQIIGMIGKQRIQKSPEIWQQLEGFIERSTQSDTASALSHRMLR